MRIYVTIYLLFGEITHVSEFIYDVKMDKNNATNKKQLKRILALNQLLNIAEYYNRLHTTNIEGTTIMYDKSNKKNTILVRHLLCIYVA